MYPNGILAVGCIPIGSVVILIMGHYYKFLSKHSSNPQHCQKIFPSKIRLFYFSKLNLCQLFHPVTMVSFFSRKNNISERIHFMKVSTEIDNNFGYEKIRQLVDNIPLKENVQQLSNDAQFARGDLW
jgi:hypothetical protein